MARPRRLLLWLLLWAGVLLPLAVTLVILIHQRWVPFALATPAIMALAVIARTSGERKGMLILLLAGLGFYLQVVALSSLFLEQRLQKGGASDAQMLEMVQTLTLLGDTTEYPDLKKPQEVKHFEDSVNFVRGMQLLQESQLADVRNSLTPNYLDLSLFAAGALASFGAAVLDAAPDSSLPKMLKHAEPRPLFGSRILAQARMRRLPGQPDGTQLKRPHVGTPTPHPLGPSLPIYEDFISKSEAGISRAGDSGQSSASDGHPTVDRPAAENRLKDRFGRSWIGSLAERARRGLAEIEQRAEAFQVAAAAEATRLEEQRAAEKRGASEQRPRDEL